MKMLCLQNEREEYLSSGATEYRLGPVSAIPLGEGRTYDLGSLRLAIFRARSGRLYATQAVCPHRGGPLADGLLDDSLVICPLHAYKFELSSGQPVGNDCPGLQTYAVDVDATGTLVVRLDEPPAQEVSAHEPG